MDTLDNFESAVLLKDRAYEVLKFEIIRGHFGPGDRLSISELANKMNISYAPVREALNLLCKEGLVELHPHKQAVVTAGNDNDYEITVKLRLMLEPFAAEISTNLVPEKRLEEMRRILTAVLDNPKDELAYIKSDMQIHEMLHIYAGSKMLSEMLESLKTYNLRYRYLNEGTGGDQAPEPIYAITQEHLKILEAFETRDPAAVRAAVTKHIEGYHRRSTEAKRHLREKEETPKSPAYEVRF